MSQDLGHGEEAASSCRNSEETLFTNRLREVCDGGNGTPSLKNILKANFGLKAENSALFLPRRVRMYKFLL